MGALDGAGLPAADEPDVEFRAAFFLGLERDAHDVVDEVLLRPPLDLIAPSAELVAPGLVAVGRIHAGGHPRSLADPSLPGECPAVPGF